VRAPTADVITKLLADRAGAVFALFKANMEIMARIYSRRILATLYKTILPVVLTVYLGKAPGASQKTVHWELFQSRMVGLQLVYEVVAAMAHQIIFLISKAGPQFLMAI